MIEFNENDYNLTKIRKESKLFNLVTKYPYRVYGLREGKNYPPILLEWDSELNKIKQKTIEDVVDFFKNNKIDVKWAYDDGADGLMRKINIGLRRDLREHITLSAAILQTIIYAIEGRLRLKKSFKIKGLPRFV